MGKQGMRGPQLATAVEPSEQRRVRPADLVPAWGWLAGRKQQEICSLHLFFNVRYKRRSKILHTVPEACKPPRQLEKELLRETCSQRFSRDRKGKEVAVHKIGVTGSGICLFLPSVQRQTPKQQVFRWVWRLPKASFPHLSRAGHFPS